MNCTDAEKAFSETASLPFAAQEHVRSCSRCSQLFSALIVHTPADPPSPATLRQIVEGLAADLRPVRPMAPAGYFVGTLAAIFVALVAIAAYGMGAFAIAVMTPLQTTAILTALAISAGLLVHSLVNQMAPGSRHRIPPGLLPVGITISLMIAIAVLFRFHQEPNFRANAWTCIRAGSPIGIFAALPFWLVLRRGATLSPSMSGAATGLLAGLAGTSVLEFHCPNLNAWHILLAHLGVAVLCSLAGLIIGLSAEIRDRRPLHH